ncbi:hypothetical protein [Actinophytocola xanthii]|uniref:Uncharacterized protein n=1 Tax=Actinophytocola xanthii TaxID=1912961 RepID=A0A1Q8CU60_9PSEU|nr:hypothetical protein [Actinophytocola xanthii]OLF17886.1 hypothetical protein BU204_08725 [Actinophytocola xanthii]
MPLQTPDDDRRPVDPLAKRFDEDLLGLDPDDPEARAFAEHLERQQRVRPGFTVEGYLSGMDDFAASANRLGGHRKLMASLLAMLILLGVIVAAWDALVYVVSTFAN